MSALSARIKKDRPFGRSFDLFYLIETRVGHRVSRGGFRTLRSPTQGSALRTRKPFEKGLSESFIILAYSRSLRFM